VVEISFKQKFLLPSPIQPPIRDAMAKASEREEKKLPVIDFSSGNVGKMPFNQRLFSKMDIEINKDLPEGLQIIAVALKKGILDSFFINSEGLAYTPTGGTNTVKKQVIKYFSEVHGIPLTEKDTNRVIATAGGQQAMTAALRSTRPGTNIYLPKWDYAPVSSIIKNHNCNDVRIEVNDDLSLNMDNLEENITDNSVFYSSMPNNPIGYVAPRNFEAVI